jgi:hypothetical protein
MEHTDSLFKELTEEKGKKQNGKTGNDTKHV